MMRKRILKILVALICIAISSFVYAKEETFNGVVRDIKDGDTIVIDTTAKPYSVVCRLYGIDAPETDKPNKKGQPYGEEAKKFLRYLILGKSVKVETTGSKTYNREVCRIFHEGKDINLTMVKEGYAWAYVEYLKRPHASEYIDAEREARKEKKGLWKDINPTPPWEFRRNSKYE